MTEWELRFCFLLLSPTSRIHFSQGISLCEIFMACVSHPFKRNSLRIVIFLFGNPLSIEPLLVHLTYSTSFLSLSLWFAPNGSYLTSSNLSKILLNKAKRKKTQPEKYARRKLLLSTWLALFGFWVRSRVRVWWRCFFAFHALTPATNVILSKFLSFIFLFGIVFKREKRLNAQWKWHRCESWVIGPEKKMNSIRIENGWWVVQRWNVCLTCIWIFQHGLWNSRSNIERGLMYMYLKI